MRNINRADNPTGRKLDQEAAGFGQLLAGGLKARLLRTQAASSTRRSSNKDDDSMFANINPCLNIDNDDPDCPDLSGTSEWERDRRKDDRDRDFRRWVRANRLGGDALERLLSSSNNLLCTAGSSYTSTGNNSTAGSERRAVVQAYLQLALVDVVTAAWVQKAAELQMEEAVSGSSLDINQQLQQASSALCGCRYLRLEAAMHLAKVVHTVLDAQGHHPGLNLSGMPLPHSVGLNFRQLLVQGLKVGDLHNPTLRGQPESSLECHSWDEYYANASNASLCGDWEFCSWTGVARFEPAPHAKFSTAELMAQLEPHLILSSLSNGMWGRVLVAAAVQVGISLDCLPSAANGQEDVMKEHSLVTGKEVVRQVLALNAARVEIVAGSMKQAAVTAASAVVMAAAQLRQGVDSVLLVNNPAQDPAGAVGGSLPDAMVEPVVARR
eukprot:gene11479-11623_t